VPSDGLERCATSCTAPGCGVESPVPFAAAAVVLPGLGETRARLSAAAANAAATAGSAAPAPVPAARAAPFKTPAAAAAADALRLRGLRAGKGDTQPLARALTPEGWGWVGEAYAGMVSKS